MPNLTLNEFASRYTRAVGLTIFFPDWLPAKKANKGAPLVLTGSNGKTVPTPNQVARKLAKQLTCDYHLRSAAGGSAQQIIAPTVADIAAICQLIRCIGPSPMNEPPCALVVNSSLDMREHIHIARQLGLI